MENTNETQNYYPDSHPVLRENLMKQNLPGGGIREFVPRDLWEKTAAERDKYRRVLALIGAWRLDSGTRNPQLDKLLSSVGEDYENSQALKYIIDQVREGTL